MTGIDHLLGAALENPELARLALDKADAEDSLLGFIRVMWPVVEPAREFTEGWVVNTICEHLEAISNGEITRLLINVPPGCMKSLTTNVFWPAWEWGPRNRPATKYVSAAYSRDLTIRDNRRSKMLVESDEYQALWGDRFKLSIEQNSKTRYDTDKTGFRIATSVSGGVTGERGDRVIIDDPHNVKEGDSEAIRNETLRWFSEVVPTRINDARESAILVIMQRVHERDVSGMILAEELNYEHLCIPMEYEADHPHKSKTSLHFVDPRKEDGEFIWPERFPPDYVEDELKPSMRAFGGTYAEAGQLQQRPAPRGGGMFRVTEFVTVDSPPPVAVKRVRGWDLAGTKSNRADWTVGVLMSIADDKIYVEDVQRIRGGPGEVEELIKNTADMDGPGVIIDLPQDPGQAGKGQVRYLTSKLNGYTVRSTPESGSKEQRAMPMASQVMQGLVHIVRAPWNREYLEELEKFPAGQYDDQVDASSRAHQNLVNRPGRAIPSGPIIVRDVR